MFSDVELKIFRNVLIAAGWSKDSATIEKIRAELRVRQERRRLNRQERIREAIRAAKASHV